MMFEEITASSLVKIGMDGRAVSDSPYAVNPAGFTIHSAVHEAREDAGCVMHLHTPDGTAVATTTTKAWRWTTTNARVCSRISGQSI